MTHRNVCRLAVWLGLLSFPAFAVAFAALQDIFHREADLTLEWAALRVSFLIVGMFHAVALFALWKTLAR